MRKLLFILMLFFFTGFTGCLSTKIRPTTPLKQFQEEIKSEEETHDVWWFVVCEDPNFGYLTWFLHNVQISYTTTGGICFRDSDGRNIILSSDFSYMIIKLDGWTHHDFIDFFDNNGDIKDIYRNAPQLDKDLENLEKEIEKEIKKIHKNQDCLV